MPSIAQLDGPVVKRRRLDLDDGRARDLTSWSQSRQSRLYAPYRTVGLVSPTQVPFTSVAKGTTTFQITTSVGRSLQTYDLKKGLNLLFITRPQTPGHITATASWGDSVLAAWSDRQITGERGVWLFKRGKKCNELPLIASHDEDIVQLLVLGPWIVGCGLTKIEVWNALKLEHYTTLIPPFNSTNTEGAVLTGGICGLPTFTNKVFAGRENGDVEIWNVSTGQLVYNIQPPDATCGPVTALQPSPALSLLGIAYMNGTVNVHNVSTDQVVIRLKAGQAKFAPVTSMSFRTDGLGAGEDGRSEGVLATGSIYTGDVSLWDLNGGGRRMGTLVDAHRVADPDADAGTGLSKVEFLPGQAVMVTSGADNSLKTWIFDEMPFSPLPRPLHARGGHSGPINQLGFLPESAEGSESEGKWILSGSQDQSFRGWSLRKDAQSTELSQGNIGKKAKKLSALNGVDGYQGESSLKAPPVTSFACSLNRDGGIGALPGVKTLWTTSKQRRGLSKETEQNLTGWESIVTGHAGDKYARTWFWGRKRAGRWLLETGDGSNVTAVAMSPCGTFAIVGSKEGCIDMFNLQSGQHRQRFPAKLTPAQAKQMQLELADKALSTGFTKGAGKHKQAITGLAVDNLNRTLISCSIEGTVRFWDFHTGHLLHQIDWRGLASILHMEFHQASNLLALTSDDSRVRVIDIETRKVVRDLGGVTSEITSLCFSNDARWLVVASADGVIRTWDLPTGHLIDAMRLRAACNAVAFSPTGEYLATALSDSIGIDIWTNRTLFSHVPNRAISESEIALMEGPTASGEGGINLIDSASSGVVDDPLENGDLPSVWDDAALDRLSKGITTLSLVPRSRWQTLLNLDLIRQRNRPVEPPKAPEKAPFFLPSLPDSSAAADSSSTAMLAAENQMEISEAERSRIRLMDRTSASENTFTSLLASISSTSSDPHDATDAQSQLVAHLRALNPSTADIAIRTLEVAPPYTQLVSFVRALTQQLHKKRDYELVQAWMAVFLRIHGDVVREAAELAAARGDGHGEGEDELVAVLKTWRALQKEESERLGRLAGYCGGVVGFLRGLY